MGERRPLGVHLLARGGTKQRGQRGLPVSQWAGRLQLDGPPVSDQGPHGHYALRCL